MSLTQKQISQFRKLIWQFYTQNKRPMPWRETTNPYRILVSEIMLQQTQVPRVLKKYPQFIAAFPDFHQLNKASLAQVLAVWQGMGYNRRAKYLKQIAQQIVEELNGTLPLEPKLLETLPGIGKATAASTVVFTTNQPVVFIETNIRRIFIHHFFPKAKSVSDENILQLVEATLDQENPRHWYYALMDYGSWLGKTMINPNRRSRHYAKQSRFDGSLRQVRGQILKILLKEGPTTYNRLKQAITGNQAHFAKALKQLKKEQLVTCKQGKITLPSYL